MSVPGDGELHLWFSRQEMFSSSEDFQRDVLAGYAGVAPEDLEFIRGPNGKPALTSPDLAVSFNLTNCREHQVLAVSGGCAVGVDLEYCDQHRDVEKLARRFFSGSELHQLLACDGTRQIDRFYDFWTLKEAAIKATGGSLGRELENTCFGLTEPAWRADDYTPGCITVLGSRVQRQAWFGLMQAVDDYRLAICCIAPQDFATGIRQFGWPAETGDAHFPRLLAVSTVDKKTTEVASF